MCSAFGVQIGCPTTLSFRASLLRRTYQSDAALPRRKQWSLRAIVVDMCIIFLELCANPSPGGFRLILATNRDESFARCADNAHHWTEAPSIFGGRDMEPGREGGTWLAMDTAGQGRIAVLLNVLGGNSSPENRGRGSLISDWVRGPESAEEYVQRIKRHGLEFNPFHFIAVDLNPPEPSSGVWHYSNCSERTDVGSEVTHLREGTLSVGNSLITRPFRKVIAGEQRFKESVEKWGRQNCRDQLVEELLQLLKWNKQHLPDEEMETRAALAKTRASIHQMSVVFQRQTELNYGTRTHTVITVDSNWRCDFHEWTLEAPIDPYTSKWIHTHKIFQLG